MFLLFQIVAAQIPMQKIIQNPLQRRTHIIMSYFVEFVHTFDKFLLIRLRSKIFDIAMCIVNDNYIGEDLNE